MWVWLFFSVFVFAFYIFCCCMDTSVLLPPLALDNILPYLYLLTPQRKLPYFFSNKCNFSDLRSDLIANKHQLHVRTAWPGNKTSIVSNWQKLLPPVVAAANQRPDGGTEHVRRGNRNTLPLLTDNPHSLSP